MLSTKFPFIFNANADTKQKGVMIAIRDTVAFKTHKTICDPQGRFIILICDINSTTYTIVNIYAPNTRQIKFFHKVIRKIRTEQKGLLVMCGDFNVTPDPMIDSTAKPKHSPPSLKAALRSYDLYDTWRCMNANERDYSFFSGVHKTIAESI